MKKTPTSLLAALCITAAAGAHAADAGTDQLDKCNAFGQSVINLPYDAALQEQAAGKKLRIRLVAQDGKYFPATMDYRPDRLNIEVEKLKVVRAFCG